MKIKIVAMGGQEDASARDYYAHCMAMIGIEGEVEEIARGGLVGIWQCRMEKCTDPTLGNVISPLVYIDSEKSTETRPCGYLFAQIVSGGPRDLLRANRVGASNYRVWYHGDEYSSWIVSEQELIEAYPILARSLGLS